MTQKQKESRPQLDKKLAAYTLAGAALLAPGAAQASIINVDNVNQTVNQPGDFSFNLTGPGTQDVVITAHQVPGFNTDPNNQVDVTTNGGAQVLLIAPSPSNVAALAFGDLINPSVGNWGSGGKMVGFDTVNPTFSGGDWSSSGGTNYLGFYFGAPGSPQAGWAEIATTANATGSSFTVLSYAYQTTPNAAITAGQTSDVPELSTLALLAIGGAGVIALRRRRAGNA